MRPPAARVRTAATTGTRLDLVSFYVDGFPLTRRLPPKDVIQSVRINANPFSAEFSEPGASRVEILTKPASQHFHGNGRVDFNDARMNARNVFEPAGASYQTRTFEGYIGGPVVPKHWGFLAYGGRWEQDDNVIVNATPIDPVTLEAQELHLNVGAPTRTTSYVLRSDARLRNHTVAARAQATPPRAADSPQRGVAERFRSTRTRVLGRREGADDELVGDVHLPNGRQ